MYGGERCECREVSFNGYATSFLMATGWQKVLAHQTSHVCTLQHHTGSTTTEPLCSLKHASGNCCSTHFNYPPLSPLPFLPPSVPPSLLSSHSPPPFLPTITHLVILVWCLCLSATKATVELGYSCLASLPVSSFPVHVCCWLIDLIVALLCHCCQQAPACCLLA